MADTPRTPDMPHSPMRVRKAGAAMVGGEVPAISVAMSAYNAGPYLGEAIRSILRQSVSDFEFLILDDGSTDNTLSVAESYAAMDARIRVISRENRGLVFSLNQLLDEARAPLIARMDADDTCHPERFSRQMAFLASNPDHGLIGCDCTNIGPDGASLERPELRRPEHFADLQANFETGPLILHNGVIYRRDLVRQVGGYRAAYAHAEDYDLWLRLSQVTKLANLPDNLVAYRIYPDQVSNRHLVEQARNAAIAWLAHKLRMRGQADPTDAARKLPQDGELDALFGAGSAAYVRRRVVERALYAPVALFSDGWQMLLDHVHDQGANGELWRLAMRMLKSGMPLHAGRLGMALMLA
jgi:glycosyltransferase involved in cell wall biosynthesis